MKLNMTNNFKILKYVFYLVEVLRSNIIFVGLNKTTIILDINKDNLIFIFKILKYHFNFQYKQLICMSGVDNFQKINRFNIHYFLLSLIKNNRLQVRVSVEEFGFVPSI